MRVKQLGMLLVVLFGAVDAKAQGVQSVSLSAPAAVALPLNVPHKAGTVQSDRYRVRMQSLEEHDFAVPTRAAPIPFSARLSTNKLVAIKPRPQALLSNGINVTDQVDVTGLVHIDYNYVSPVAEPSVAVAGKKILITFNWGALWSSDGGKSFQQLDPFTLFEEPKPADGTGFCCDQLALYDSKHDLVIWLLQGDESSSGDTIRLLFAKSSDLVSGQSLRWHTYDFTPKLIGSWEGEWFDFPDMAVTDQYLFISLNSFSTGSQPDFNRSVVLRFPLADLASYGPTKADMFHEEGISAFSPRFTQGSGDKIYWATHDDTAHLLVRAWPDNASSPVPAKRVTVEPYQYPAGGAEGPNGKPWLTRLDDRITAGWAMDEKLGFAWTSGPIMKAVGIASYPLPHIRVAIIERSAIDNSSQPIVLSDGAQPHIWSSTYALAYPTAAPSRSGDIGVGLYFGGSTKYPSAAVGFFRKAGADWQTTLTVAREGANSPRCLVDSTHIDNACGKWGDYLAIRADPSVPNGWHITVATERDVGTNEQPKIAITFLPFRSTSVPSIVSSDAAHN